MFDDLKPDQIPAPPARALPDAVRRGTSIRRRRRAGWAAGVAAAVVVTVAVVLSSPFSATDQARVVPATATAAPKDYTPITTVRSEAEGLTFGYLQGITENADGTLTLRIQPGYFYLGEEAKTMNGGEYPLDDVLQGEKEGTEPTDFRLDPKAPLRGANALLGYPEDVDVDAGRPITTAQLTENFEAVGEPRDVGVWFRLGGDGTITALSEQYIS
ncbi:hypothetical protein KIH74_27195 [Kineosporia sp. J2-2]|uniref:Uncharacterized protein n=1 Tax=Kineosporia corallincola TaxID=2835133 RepID=A0ABS5TNT5_9ACTN|nr:hypothetical protein [Kineosporia corallincola]MBT0772660.1 hypothetical protein [Kineosporia corallincola]